MVGDGPGAGVSVLPPTPDKTRDAARGQAAGPHRPQSAGAPRCSRAKMSNITAWHAWCATPGDLTQTCVLYTTFFPAFFAAILAYGTAVIIARRKLHGIRKSIRKNSARPFDDPVFASCGMLETQCSTVIEASTERSTVEARPSESMAARPSESLSGAPPPPAALSAAATRAQRRRRISLPPGPSTSDCG